MTVYVSDLDGTLLDADARLSATTRAALLRVIDAGLLFTVASARSRWSIYTMLGDLPLQLPIVEFDGAYVTELTTGKHLVTHAMTPETVQTVVETTLRHGLPPFVAGHDGERDRMFHEQPRNAGMEWYMADRRDRADPRVRRVPDVAAAAAGLEAICSTSIGSREQIARVAEEVRGAAGAAARVLVFENRYSPGWWWMSVHAADATKANAVRALRRRAGLEGRRLVAFGDAENDRELLESADHAVAVGNAEPGILGLADEVIGDHTEDAVATYLLAAVRGC